MPKLHKNWTRKIKKIEHDIEQYIVYHFSLEYELPQSIPDVKQHSVAIILAEIGPSIEAFRTVSYLASWTGLSPGPYESVGKKKSSRVTRGNKYFKTALITSRGMPEGHVIQLSDRYITEYLTEQPN